MSNMDLLMGFIAFLVFVFVALPMIGSIFAPHDNYTENLKTGLAVVIAVMVMVLICMVISLPFVYFLGGNDRGPLFELTNFVNNL